MKATAFPTKKACGLVVLFLLSFFGRTEAVTNDQECQWVPVDQNSFAEILTMINRRVEENYDRIKTWQGKVKIVTENVNEDEGRKRLYEQILVDKPLPNKIIDHVELTKEFAVDANKGLLYEGVYPDAQQQIIDAQTGRNLQLKELVQIGSGKSILTPNYHLYCRENKDRDGIIVSRTVIKQTRPAGELTCQGHLRPVFDPRETMRIFGDITGKSFAPLGGAFAKYLAYIDKHGQTGTLAGYTMKVEVEECNVGDVKKYKIVLPGVMSGGPKVYISSTLVCSSDAGFNIVSYLTTADYDKVIEKKAWRYGLVNGVYLPLQTTKVHFDYQTGNLQTQTTYTFVAQTLNEALNDAVFTYKNLGLQDGDKFVDKIEGKKYIYQKGVLAEIKDPNGK